MAYTDIRDSIIAAAGVSATAHNALALQAVERATRYLLRNFNFPESVVKYTTGALDAETQTVDLELGTGKIKGVRLLLDTDEPFLYKVLRRREETVLPYADGPAAYSRIGEQLVLDKALPAAGYKLEIWYQTVDPDVAESWLTQTYEDVLFHLSILRALPLLRKPELMRDFAPLWQQDEAVLAVYLNEIEFENLDLRMGNDEVQDITERYPAS